MRSFEEEKLILMIVQVDVELLQTIAEIIVMTHADLVKISLIVFTKMLRKEMRDS